MTQWDKFLNETIGGSDHSPSPSVLAPVGVYAHPLDVTIPANRDDGFLVGDEVFLAHLFRFARNDFCPSLISIFLLEIQHFLPENIVHPLGWGENVYQPRNVSQRSLVVIFSFLLFQFRQAIEGHIEDHVCLEGRHPKPPGELTAGFFPVLRSSDDLDDLIQIGASNLIAL